MENSKGPSSIRNTTYNGKSSFLPPKSPFPSISPSYLDFIPSSVIGQKGIPKPREGNSHHQRTSSESFLVEEQPSWLDELLNEPETPVRKGAHRRSSSDSFAYIDTSNVANLDFLANDGNNSRNITPPNSWALPDFDYYKDARHASFYSDPNPSRKLKNRAYDASLNSAVHPRGLPSPAPRDKSMIQSLGSSSSPHVVDGVSSTTNEKQDSVDAGPQEPKGFSERKESSHVKSSASETDTKRAKQQFAQRSRVRKLQYIAELERNVQALQAEGSDISAELDFLNQQNLILSMENKALNQRLESLAQEQLIKHLEHEVLEREIGRLRALYQQQQQPSSGLRRTSSRDLDQQLANLSLKHKESNAGRDLIHGQHQPISGLRRTSSRDLDQQQPSSGLRRTNSRDLDQQLANLYLIQKEANAGRDFVPGQQQPISSHQRTSSRDLDQQLAMLSLKHKEANAGHHDSFPGQLHI